MMNSITEDKLIESIRAGVERTINLISSITDYHGGPVTTEYVLTADIAREFMERGYEVKIECLNRLLTNVLTAKDLTESRAILKSRRTDIALVNLTTPLAIIELKIGVKTLKKIRGDLDKISDTISLLKPKFARRVIGAVVFQVHIAGNRNRIFKNDFLVAVVKLEERIREALVEYAKARPCFLYEMKSLQSESAGIVERDLEFVGDEQAWGQDGHATKYYAITIKNLSIAPAPSKGSYTS